MARRCVSGNCRRAVMRVIDVSSGEGLKVSRLLR